VTFERDARDRRQLLRFVTLAMAGLVLSSGITVFVCSALGGPLLAAQLAVAVAVPMLSFLGSKFWAFAA
jgi:putative flippase GtrA